MCPSPTDEEWEKIGERVAKDLPSYTDKNPAALFGSDAKNKAHNDIRNSLQAKGKKGNLNKYAIVKHYQKLLPGIRNKLVDDKRVIAYTYNGQVKYRNASFKWTPEETEKLKVEATKESDKKIAKELGRSEDSIRKKRRQLGIKKGE